MPRERLSPDLFALPVDAMREGFYTDAYFDGARRVLLEQDLHPRVTMQVFQKQEDSVLCGMDEALAALRLCAGRFAVDGEDRRWEPGWDELVVHALRDGDELEPWETVLTIEGDYGLFAHLETVYLGMLGRRTLIASNVRRVVRAAAGKPVLYFPARFDHWAVQPGDGYAAHLGGATGVSTDAQAAWWGGRGIGTVPHALIASCGGDTVEAVRRFADVHYPRGRRRRAGRLRQRQRRHQPRVRAGPRRAPVGRAPGHERDHGRPLALARHGQLPPGGRRAGAGARGAARPRRGRVPARAHRGERRASMPSASPASRPQGVPVDAYGVGSSLLPRRRRLHRRRRASSTGGPCAKVGREYRPNPRLERVR